MELTDTDATITLLAGLAIVVGIFGVIVPALPGLVVCWLGVLAWALLTTGGWGKWVVLLVATGVAAVGMVVKYAWPGRKLKRTGVPYRSLFAGGVLAVVGFFVVPVVGLVLGFLLGIWLAERVRLGDSRRAWRSTVHALKATGLAMLIELGAALTIAVVWGAGLLLT
ncbi:MAG: DUF456 domain-containing protein [Micromonosporaceae bacterium]